MKKDELREYIRNLKPIFVREYGTTEDTSSYTIEDFINKFGIVTDAELAKELLCINPLAWDVLSTSLKKNPEINLYHQPLGIITFKNSINEIGNFPVKFGDNIVMTPSNLPCVPKGFFPRVNGHMFLAIPTVFSDDFELSMKYIDIQQALIEQSEVVPLSNILLSGKEFNTHTFERVFGIPLDEKIIFSSGAKMIVYNLELLKTIVPMFFNPNTK